MRRPWFLSLLGGTERRDPAPDGGSGAAPDDSERTAERRALAERNGWRYAERAQRTIVGWPRPALPSGRLGSVRNAVSGERHGHGFMVFDYLYVSQHTGRWDTLLVHAVALPVRVPYVEVHDPEGGAHDLYTESPEVRFPVDLLSAEVREEVRRYAFTDFILDGDVFICTASGGGPSGIESKLDAMTTLLDQVPTGVWTHWSQT
ncbi:hypothetical protein HDA32_004832 [Spinactinospora alkalitolerans]|uniref:Uncharacterized protein n=1 Tax=Spinactinospora alkalitolerans TaxID=687207 RepID=A0A852U2Q3_9ACTN|nr:hypothetical protein [Spinactinospora alkalitolerans]NYE49712.1 hypothetical protein [Spinactinospora alkalitolerans]